MIITSHNSSRTPSAVWAVMSSEFYSTENGDIAFDGDGFNLMTSRYFDNQYNALRKLHQYFYTEMRDSKWSVVSPYYTYRPRLTFERDMQQRGLNLDELRLENFSRWCFENEIDPVFYLSSSIGHAVMLHPDGLLVLNSRAISQARAAFLDRRVRNEEKLLRTERRILANA